MITGGVVILVSFLIVCCAVVLTCLLGDSGKNRRWRIGQVHHLPMPDLHSVIQNGHSLPQNDLGTPVSAHNGSTQKPRPVITNCTYVSEQTAAPHDIRLPVYSTTDVEKPLPVYSREPPPPYNEYELPPSSKASSAIPKTYPCHS